MKPKVVVPALCGWVGTIGSLIVADVVLDKKRNGTTLSESARWLFRTDTKIGKTVFVAGWGYLTWWLIPHICKIPAAVENAVETVMDMDLTNLTN